MKRIANVSWETDGEAVELPGSVELPAGLAADSIADWLSDKYGWLVKSFTVINIYEPDVFVRQLGRWLEKNATDYKVHGAGPEAAKSLRACMWKDDQYTVDDDQGNPKAVWFSTEGVLNHALHYGTGGKLRKKFDLFLAKRGYKVKTLANCFYVLVPTV